MHLYKSLISITFLVIVFSVGSAWGALPNPATPNQNINWDDFEQFDASYTYQIQTTYFGTTPKLSAGQMEKKPEGVLITLDGKKNFIHVADMVKIIGYGGRKTGNHGTLGAVLGGAGGLGFGLIASGPIGNLFCPSQEQACLDRVKGLLVGGGVAAGALMGWGLGKVVPKRTKITILPPPSKKPATDRLMASIL